MRLRLFSWREGLLVLIFLKVTKIIMQILIIHILIVDWLETKIGDGVHALDPGTLELRDWKANSWSSQTSRSRRGLLMMRSFLPCLTLHSGMASCRKIV